MLVVHPITILIGANGGVIMIDGDLTEQTQSMKDKGENSTKTKSKKWSHGHTIANSASASLSTEPAVCERSRTLAAATPLESAAKPRTERNGTPKRILERE